MIQLKPIELIAFNGEDYYDAPGQKQYLYQNKPSSDNTGFVINLDGVGYINSKSCYSFYNCPQEVIELVKNVFVDSPDIIEGDPWYQGDHMIFVQNQIPAMAVTTEQFQYIMTEIAHTEKDKPDLVDPVKLAQVAVDLRDIALSFSI